MQLRQNVTIVAKASVAALTAEGLLVCGNYFTDIKAAFCGLSLYKLRADRDLLNFAL